MRLAFATVLLLNFVTVLASCGGGRVLVESTPRPGPASGIEAPSSPNGIFDVPVPEDKWIPATISSGKGEDLARALADRKTVAMVLPKRSRIPALEERVFQMIKAAAPETRVVARGRAVLDKLLEERGEIPYRVTLQPGGKDILGRPYYLPKEHPLKTDWLERKGLLKGAEGLLAVRPIKVDDLRLRELRKGRQGGCDDFENKLHGGLDQAREFFRPYESGANEILKVAFSRHLKVALPYWRKEMDKAAQVVAPGDPEARCLDAYRAFIDSYEACLDGSCKLSPRIYLMGGGFVAMVDNGLLIPKNCPVEGMRDYALEIEDMTSRAVSEALPALDGGWAGELTRYGGLEQLSRGIKEVCAPRHRRVQPQELQSARGEVTSYLNDLKGRDLSGVWEPARGMERVPGIGPVRVLARIRASGHDPVVTAKELAKRLRRLDRCVEGTERLFQATLIDVGTSEVPFMGIFFEEELMCNGLPPGSP